MTDIEMTEHTETTLYAKLAEVTAELGYVAKDGKNEFQNYRYTSAEALLAAVRVPLSARGIVLMPSLTALSEREYQTAKGKASIVTTAHVSFTFVDGATGERHKCEWAGQGDDPADKGLGKAYTNAIKTFVREQFLIPQGDDPEADSRTDDRAADRVPSNSAPGRVAGNGAVVTEQAEAIAGPTVHADPPQPTEPLITAPQVRLLHARCGEIGLDDRTRRALIHCVSGQPHSDRVPKRLLGNDGAKDGEARSGLLGVIAAAKEAQATPEVLHGALREEYGERGGPTGVDVSALIARIHDAAVPF